MPINFQRISNKLAETRGYCFLPFDKYAFIYGIRYNRHTGSGKRVQLYWLIEEHFVGEPSLVFLNGSTGYESFFVEHILTWPQQSDLVAICAGCRNYDRIVCSHKDMVDICQESLKHLNYHR